ncbi:MAG: hypothetical protein NT099_07065 [Candidatus Saganbacteria bacterium]|nr:hypothetical protein [Candidatus Saganbacteria bacterium]
MFVAANKIKRVALFSMSGYDLISNPLINLAKYLSKRGYVVDIFGLGSTKFAVPDFESGGINCILFNAAVFRGRFFRFFQVAYFFFTRMMGKKYSFFVGFDPPGLKMAAFISLFLRVPFIYFSLEIISKSTIKSWRQHFQKWLESKLSFRALLSITQDKKRAEILARENGLNLNKIMVIHNSPLGEPLKDKSFWLRDKFEINDSRIIVLAVGSLIPEHLIEELVNMALYWSEQYVLVLHGWFANAAFETKIKSIIGQSSGKIILSTELLPIAQKYQVFQSADIGLAVYRPAGDNFLYTGLAAGKIFDFLRCGIPVVVNDLPGMKGFLQDTGAGEVVADLGDIESVLPRIISEREKYAKAAFKLFEQYENSKSSAVVIDRIESALKIR